MDCVLLFEGGPPRDVQAHKELRAGLPFLDMALVRPKRFRQYVTRLYAADRWGAAKGMVEVILDAPR